MSTRTAIDIAVANAPRDAEIRHIGSIKGDLASLDKAIRKLLSRNQPLHIVYEAGPYGFVIQRHLCAQGLPFDVVAPSSGPSADERLWPLSGRCRQLGSEQWRHHAAGAPTFLGAVERLVRSTRLFVHARDAQGARA